MIFGRAFKSGVGLTIILTKKVQKKMRFLVPGIMFMGMFALGESGYDYNQNLKLNVAPLQSVGNGALGYHLQCDGAVGNVKYRAEGLPAGASLNGDRIIIGATTKAGDYYVKITA